MTSVTDVPNESICGGRTDDQIAETVRRAVHAKKSGHGIDTVAKRGTDDAADDCEPETAAATSIAAKNYALGEQPPKESRPSADNSAVVNQTT